MNRTSLSLPDDLVRALRHEARQRHTSVSAVVRETLAERFGSTGQVPREVPFAAIGRSGDGHVAKQADRRLAQVFEDRDERRRDDRRRR